MWVIDRKNLLISHSVRNELSVNRGLEKHGGDGVWRPHPNPDPRARSLPKEGCIEIMVPSTWKIHNGTESVSHTRGDHCLECRFLLVSFRDHHFGYNQGLKRSMNKETQYFIKYKGFPLSESKWLDEAEMSHCTEVVTKFEKKFATHGSAYFEEQLAQLQEEDRSIRVEWYNEAGDSIYAESTVSRYTQIAIYTESIESIYTDSIFCRSQFRLWA